MIQIKIAGLAAALVLTSLATASADLGSCLATCSNGGPGYQGFTSSLQECCAHFNEICGAWGTAIWSPLEGPAYECPQA